MRSHCTPALRRPVLLAVAVTALAATGCGGDARGVLDGMGRAYRTAAGYSDQARVRIRYVRQDREVEQSLPLRVAFQRPDRLRIDGYDARIAADGTTLRAAVGTVPGQVLEEPVRSPLTLDQVFADEQVRLALAGGDAGCPPQLPLLLADDTLDLIVADAVEPPRRTGTEPVDGHACDVVTIPKPDGTLTLWIDRRTRLLRRMALPTGGYKEVLEQRVGPVGGLAVVVDFTAATFTAPPPATAFAFDVPPGAARVDRLEPPPVPQPPTPLVGRPAPPFVLAAPDGTTVSSAQLTGSIVVLEFFHTACSDCRRSMPAVGRAVATAAAARGDGPEIRHCVVSVDEADVTDDTLRTTIEAWGGGGTLLRDPRSVVASGLEIATFPAVVVLTPAGTVADVLLGHDHRLADDLAESCAAVAAGTPTAPLLRDRFEARLQDHRRLLEQVGGGGVAERLPPQRIAPRRQPDRFKLERVWRAGTVALPGNVLCLDGAEGGRTVALDGWRTVVELDGDGRQTARHELDLPPDAAVTFLRTAVDAAGARWWLGGSRGGQQVFVFDDAWRLHAAYPAWESPPHAGVRTAQLADMNRDGTPEIVVAYAGTVGVQVASLDGRRLWRERSFDTVLDVVPDAPHEDGGRGLVCVTGRGRLVPVRMDAGPTDAPGPVLPPDWSASPAIHALFAGPVAAGGGWSYVGLARSPAGGALAVGLGPLPEQFWELAIPDGVHRDGPIEPVAWADLLGTPRRQWLIAAPDGTVVVAWADGRVVDRYRHGAALVGIGGYRRGGEGIVVLATREAVEGYRVADVALD